LNITTSSKCLEKVVLPQTKALNIISLKNLQINQKENNNKYMSQSPKIKDLKLVQTPSNNNIMKIVKNIPQSTKTNEVKIAFDPTKTSYNSTIKGVNVSTKGGIRKGLSKQSREKESLNQMIEYSLLISNVKITLFRLNKIFIFNNVLSS